jgi:APA family basic amino acid/polyamine antiporter
VSAPDDASAPSRLGRRLGLGDAVVVGLGAMLGAGVFAAFGPAAASAGSGLLVGLGIAAVVAYCNATSSARLAAVHPESGGTYVYGRERLGPFWGYLAGWGFVVGKTASGAAMALTAGAYLGEDRARAVAVAAVVAITVVNLFGVRKTATLTLVIVTIVVAVLAGVVVGTFGGGEASADNLGPLDAGGWRGILESAGLLFFAFAGYARIATLGEEVVEPARTIPQAVRISLGFTLVVYALVGTGALLAVGPAALAASPTPLATAVDTGSFDWLVPAVRAGGGIAALGVLLSVVLGTSRTAFAMAANGDLPRRLSAVHADRGIPHLAVAAVGVAVVVLVLVADLRGAIGFSSFCVLTYYAIANASALRLERQRPGERGVAAAGLAGCTVVALTLPGASVAAGAAVLAVGAVAWAVRSRRALSRRTRRG